MRTTGGIRARDGWLVGLAVAGLLVVSAAARAGHVSAHSSRRSHPGVPLAPKVRQPTLRNSGETSRPHHWAFRLHLPQAVFSALGELVALVLVLVLIGLLVSLMPRLQRRRPRPPVPPVSFAPADAVRLGEQLSEALGQTLDRLRRGDREDAIIDCWLRMEQLAEAAGCPSQTWQTSGELVDRWLQVLPLSKPPLVELGELYREARYSTHRMSAEDTERAQRALHRLRAELTDQHPESSRA